MLFTSWTLDQKEEALVLLYQWASPPGMVFIRNSRVKRSQLLLCPKCNTCTSNHTHPLCKKGDLDKFILNLCSTAEGIRSHCPFCLFVQSDNETAIHIFILGIHCCFTPRGFMAHTLLRTACGKDVFCEKRREYALIEKKTACSFPNCWQSLCLCRQLRASLTHLLSTEMQGTENSGKAEGKEDPKIKLTLRTWDPYKIFSTANEKPLIVLEAINSGPKIIWLLTKTCQRLSHLASQVVNGCCLLLYIEEIVFKLS